MADQLNTLFELIDVIEGLNTVQDWVDTARVVAKTNQVVQLELDRKQTEIDRKRELVEALMFDIRSRN